MSHTYSYNQTDDAIKYLQRALNEQLQYELKIDGHLGKITQDALKHYQTKYKVLEKDKFGPCYGPLTQAHLKAYIQERFLTENDFEVASFLLEVDVATVKTVMAVESKEFGFLSNGFPVMLFERHHFYKHIKTQYGPKRADQLVMQRPDLCNPQAGGYRGGLSEVRRFAEACEHYEQEAIQSTSFGLFQILGSNYKACGYPDLYSFFEEMKESERKQLYAFCHFIRADKNLHRCLSTQNWTEFARRYNGPGYNRHAVSYDVRLAQAYAFFKANEG